MTRFSRGAALVETALSVSLVLMLVLGTAQMALIGYNQISADGAAFIASHTAAADPSASPDAVAHSVFNNIPASAVTPSPASGMAQYSVSKSIPGFSLIPGLSQQYTIGGGDTELAPSPPPTSGPVYAISFNATLYNYCMPSAVCSFPQTYSMYLAQKLLPYGNGVNGEFQEWGCHAGYFDNLAKDFPSSMPLSITSGSALDPSSAGSDENTVYSWDSGTPCV
ncbi:MAG TPA: TadE family protein [Candidatus Baltobacteraceae bacterium]|nr:TadE family protein [Candidatus Baltobacteraceae bacterium]